MSWGSGILIAEAEVLSDGFVVSVWFLVAGDFLGEDLGGERCELCEQRERCGFSFRIQCRYGGSDFFSLSWRSLSFALF